MFPGSSIYTRPRKGRLSNHGTRDPAELRAEESDDSDDEGLATSLSSCGEVQEVAETRLYGNRYAVLVFEFGGVKKQ